MHDGPSLPADALALAWDLENAGYSMREDRGALKLHAGPGAKALDAEAKAKVAQWKPHLLAIVEYCGRDRS